MISFRSAADAGSRSLFTGPGDGIVKVEVVLMEVRRSTPGDADAVRKLACRLTIGVAPWRNEDAVLSAVRAWVDDALAGHDDQHPVFVAEVTGGVVGFVAAGTRTHWAGDTDAYIGELVVAAEHTGRGIGRALMAAVEDWAREFGYTRMTLETGALNQGGRAFYSQLGYTEEEVVLTRQLN